MSSKRRRAKEIAINYDSGKPCLALLPPYPLVEVTKVLEFGARKYSSHNWRRGKGLAASRNLSSALRHLFAWMEGEDRDQESGLNTLAHAACRIMFLMQTLKDHPESDDRYRPEPRRRRM